jgi:hypothetical protein
MQPVLEFMSEFFSMRTNIVRRELRDRLTFRQTFFSNCCLWDGRRRSVERSESEVITEISATDNEAVVITREVEPFPRLRYHLQAEGTRWRIWSVEVECARCLRAGAHDRCPLCRGTSWISSQDEGAVIDFLKMRRKRVNPPHT